LSSHSYTETLRESEEDQPEQNVDPTKHTYQS
jgi:hypothetical protein